VTRQPNEKYKLKKENWFEFSLDTWAVALALAVALLIRMGVINHVGW
jgi:hypothetical protein